nr:glycosyltransferase family 8 protein [uncultured Butyrivibrio sp.]
MNVSASFNRKYVDYAIVLLTSFCVNNPENNHFYIMHSELLQEDMEIIKSAMSQYDAEFTFLDASKEIENLKLPVSDFWSNEIYYRLMLPDKLPSEVDRILYLDVDVIVHGKVDDIYYSDFGDALLMAAEDSNKTNTLDTYKPKVKQMLLPRYGEDFRYFNSGVLMMNIARMRGKNTFDSYLEAMKEWDYQMAAPDQDILNYVHYAEVKYIPWEKYDLFAKLAFNSGWTYEDVKEKNKIIHFAGAKPWNFDGLKYEIERFWWEYAAMTPVYQKLMESFLENSFTNNYLEKEAIRLCNDNKEYAKAIKEADELLHKFVN